MFIYILFDIDLCRNKHDDSFCINEINELMKLRLKNQRHQVGSYKGRTNNF